MQTQEFDYAETARILELERARLLRIRESIERCELMKNVDTATAMRYHTPLSRISPQAD